MRSIPAERPPDIVDAGPVVLERLVVGHAEGLFRAVSSSWLHLRPWMPWARDEPTMTAQLDYIDRASASWREGTEFPYAVLAGGDLVGTSGLHRRIGPHGLEIGYWLAESATGRGYATAAAGALTSAGLALDGIDVVEIHCDEANDASAAVPRRLGYTLAGIRPHAVEAPGESGRRMIWRTTRGTWTAPG
jgi:RimJ/RimL family protein N-acetyltransferase